MDRELDFVASDHGKIFLLRPATAKAQVWCERELEGEVNTWKGSYIIPESSICSVLNAVVEDRLEVDHRSAEHIGRGVSRLG